MTIQNANQKRTRGRSAKTPQNKQLVLNFIHEYRRINGISPKFDEIALGIGYSKNSGGAVFELVQELIQEGWLKQVVPGARSLVPTKLSTERYAEIKDPNLQSVAKRQRNLRILRRL